MKMKDKSDYEEFSVEPYIRGKIFPQIGLSRGNTVIHVNSFLKMGEGVTTDSTGLLYNRPEKCAACETSPYITLVDPASAFLEVSDDIGCLFPLFQLKSVF